MMKSKNQSRYELIFTYDNGEQKIVGEYYILRDALQAQIRVKHEIGKCQLCGRILDKITINSDFGG